MPPSPVVHDHVVLLLEDDEFENPPTWLSENFNIIEGGVHAGGSSRNKLIVFKDGTYLELFNWINKPVEFLAWSNKKPGLIDFALTTLDPITPEQNYQNIQNNLSSTSQELDLGVSYSQPAAGGRKRADGTEVKWKTSRPSFQASTSTPDEAYFPDRRIDVPFFCHDVTERNVRVPFNREDITTHPCGAVGIESVDVLIPNSHMQAYNTLYGNVLSILVPEASIDGDLEIATHFEVGVPNALDARPTYVNVYPTLANSSGSYETSPNMDHDDYLKRHGIGIRSLVLRTAEAASQSQQIRALSDDQIGKTIKIKG